MGLPTVRNGGYLLATNLPASNILGLYISQLLTAIVFGAIIILFAMEKGLLSRALRKKELVIGGEISFSIYLFHQIFIVWQHKNPWLLDWCPQSFRFVMILAFTIVFSYGIWRWFECPMRALIRRTLDHR